MRENPLFWIGLVCRVCRQDAGITVEDAAAGMGYSKSSVYKFEAGHNDSIQMLLWYFAHTNLATWMIEPTSPFNGDIERVKTWLAGLNEYRRQMSVCDRSVTK